MKREYTNHFVQGSNVRLHVMTVGDPNAERAIIFLHGFPEYWYAWKKVTDILAETYYCIIPDQRGYNKSEKPRGISAYKVDHLVQDVVDLIEWTGRDSVHLAGHDWGAAVAWGVVSAFPEKIEKLVIVNAPHSRVLRQRLKGSFKQIRKSWYMFFFQLPLLPQLSLSLFNYSFLKKILTRTSLRGTFNDDELDEYAKAWKGSIAKMLNWYRAAFRRGSSIAYDSIENPVLILWGRKDVFLSADMATESLEYCNNGEVTFLDDSSHWVLHEFPEKIAIYINKFLQ